VGRPAASLKTSSPFGLAAPNRGAPADEQSSLCLVISSRARPAQPNLGAADSPAMSCKAAHQAGLAATLTPRQERYRLMLAVVTRCCLARRASVAARAPETPASDDEHPRGQASPGPALDRGRDGSSPVGLDPPPAQIPACTASALGSSLGSRRRNERWARDGRSAAKVAIGCVGAASAPTSAGCAGCGAAAPGTSARWRSSGRRAALSCCRARRSSWHAHAGRWRASGPAQGSAGGGVASARP